MNMKKEDKARSFLLLLVAMGVVFLGITIYSIGRDENIKTSSQYALDTKTITEKEAYEIAYPKAREWISEPRLIEIASTDAAGSPTIKSGSDGKRDAWYVYFGNEEATKTCHILIEYGEIADVHNMEEGASNRGLFNIQDVKITAKEAYEIATKQKGLQPGNPQNKTDWLIGYHYDIKWVTLIQDEDNRRLAITVYGISQNGNFAHIIIDQETGEIILAEEQTGYDEAGRSTWKRF